MLGARSEILFINAVITFMLKTFYGNYSLRKSSLMNYLQF